GAAMRGIGYDRDFDVVVAAGGRAAFALVPASGWRSVRVDAERALVTLHRGTELDLGATAKAFAADRIAEAAAEATDPARPVRLGGDIAVRGDLEGGWPVRVTDDHRDTGGGGRAAGIREGG